MPNDSELAQVLVEKIGLVMEEVFGVPDPEGPEINVVIGVQVGTVGMLASNLRPCHVGQALSGMYAMAAEDHERYHGPEGPAPYMNQTFANLSEELQTQIREVADAHGVDPETVILRQSVDFTDLAEGAEVPEWLQPVDGVPDGEQIVQTGDDDIASPPNPFDLTAKDEADLAKLGFDADPEPEW